MKMSITEMDSVKSFLNSKYMFANHSWLEGCIKYILQVMCVKDQEEVKKITAQQWLLNDLKIVSSGCLPPNLKGNPKITLREKYMLQINSEIDIGVSSYQQYCKLTNVNDEDVEATLSAEEKIPSHRMLKLTLTDGVQDICGIEYRTISKINTSLIPGCKVMIKGPVVCRSGTLFLENSSLEIMGGEVEELSKINTKAVILATKLGLNQVHQTSNSQQIEHPEETEAQIVSHERLGSHEPPEKRPRILPDEPSTDLEPNICTDHVKIVSSNPFIYIKTINDMNESAKINKTCKVKAQILHLLKKPSYSKDRWMVECKITDGTGCLNVQIDSDWFSKLVLCTPQEMAELNKKRLSNPAEIPIINRDLIKKLGKAMMTLKSLYCIMVLKISPKPIIKEFIPFEEQHVMLINKRLQGF